MTTPRQSAPDYTDAFLVSLGPLVFVALFALWIAGGILAVLAVAYASDKALARLAPSRERTG